jgi:RimJ/RimL family protein N-acetyltransferase
VLRPPDPPLEDGSIRLEPLGAGHLEGLNALGRDPDVARFTYVPVPFSEGAARSWLERYVRGWKDGALAGFAIHPADRDEFLGFIAIVAFDPDGNEAEIGYIVAPAARGRGVAKRALRLVSEWALRTVGVERLELRIEVENAASARVAESLGFVREGILRSVHFKQGRRVDMAVYSQLPSDVATS